MRKSILIFSGIICTFLLNAQTPGNVNPASLNIWLKSDAGLTFSGGTLVSQWNDQSPLGNNVSQPTAARQPDSVLSSNYNPAISFSPVGQFTTANADYLTLPEGSISFGGSKIYIVGRKAESRDVFAERTGSGSSFQFSHRGISILTFGVNYELYDAWIENGGITPPVGGTLNQTRIFRGSNPNNIIDGLDLGHGDASFENLVGEMAEFIIYGSPVPTAAQEVQIETYLAVKYGITLDNSAGGPAGNYVATNGTSIWDASVSSSYHNDVIGIGRDDSEALLQKQSHALDDATRVYISTLQTSNAANPGVFNSDVSYVISGDDQGQLCATTASLAEMPAGCGLYSRLEREWKVTKTNFAQTYNCDYTLAACGLPGSVNTADLRFLVDDDGDFSNGGTTCYFNGDGTGIVISYTTPTITVSNISGVHIPTNSTRYVTIASVNSVTPLPVELLNFTAIEQNNRRVKLDWTTITEINNDYFTVERSIDGIVWEKVFSMNGAGNSQSPWFYSNFDEDPYSGISYYRLKQTDYNGDYTYSQIVTINIDQFQIMNLYPNPSNGEFNINVNSREKGTLLISVYDQLGRVAFSDEVEITKGYNNISYNISSLAQGSYSIHIVGGNGEYNAHEMIMLNE